MAGESWTKSCCYVHLVEFPSAADLSDEEVRGTICAEGVPFPAERFQYQFAVEGAAERPDSIASGVCERHVVPGKNGATGLAYRPTSRIQSGTSSGSM